MISYLRLMGIGAAVAGVLFAAFYIYNKGSDDALDGVRKQDDKAARTAYERAMSYSDCDKRGGVYDFYTGKCRVNP